MDCGSTESTGASFTEIFTVSPLIPTTFRKSVAACLIWVDVVPSTMATRHDLRAASVINSRTMQARHSSMLAKISVNITEQTQANSTLATPRLGEPVLESER